MKQQIIGMARIYVSTLLLSFLSMTCGNIKPMDPEGFGVWNSDCSAIAVAVNQADFDGRLFMNHEINERCNLFLCDTNGHIMKTIFNNRKVGGSGSIIDSLNFNKTGDTLIIYTKRMGTGLVRKEKCSLSSESIETVEEFDVWNYGANYYDTVFCDSRGVHWNQELQWIEIIEK